MTTIAGRDTTESTSRRLATTTKFFRALGDQSRLTILSSLIDGEKNVGELVELVGLSQGRVSNHLACLKQCGFVNARRDCRFVYYSIADEEVRRLMDISEAMIARNAEQIWACTRTSAPDTREG